MLKFTKDIEPISITRTRSQHSQILKKSPCFGISIQGSFQQQLCRLQSRQLVFWIPTGEQKCRWLWQFISLQKEPETRLPSKRPIIPITVSCRPSNTIFIPRIDMGLIRLIYRDYWLGCQFGPSWPGGNTYTEGYPYLRCNLLTRVWRNPNPFCAPRYCHPQNNIFLGIQLLSASVCPDHKPTQRISDVRGLSQLDNYNPLHMLEFPGIGTFEI